MNSIVKAFFVSVLFGLPAILAATTPAAAISADLAIKCRQMAIKAHPPQRIGSKTGTAGEERKFYRDCLANGGSTPEDKTQNPSPTPSR